MFGRAIWDNLTQRIFQNFVIVREMRGQFQNFKKSRG